MGLDGALERERDGWLRGRVDVGYEEQESGETGWGAAKGGG